MKFFLLLAFVASASCAAPQRSSAAARPLPRPQVLDGASTPHITTEHPDDVRRRCRSKDVPLLGAGQPD